MLERSEWGCCGRRTVCVAGCVWAVVGWSLAVGVAPSRGQSPVEQPFVTPEVEGEAESEWDALGGTCSPPNCNGNGVCLVGVCVCNVGFVGAGCEFCAPNYYNYPACTFCQAATTCSGNGTCSSFGSCICNTGITGVSCNQCAPNHYNYPVCTFCQAGTTCSGNGVCTGSGTCACNVGFVGAACDQCAPNYYNYPTCTFCQAGTTCSGNGTCSSLGTCNCNVGIVGVACDACGPNFYNYPTCTFCLASATCNNNGTCNVMGGCNCNTGFTGTACDACAPNYYNYPTCTFCLAATTCSGNGTCHPSGGCSCNSGWTGVDCSVAATNPPLTPAPPHDRQKNRYISFVPNNGATVVAFRVAKVSSPTGSCWVQTPVQSGSDQYTAKCDATPVFRVWTEPFVHVGDCEIIPVANYVVHVNAPGPIEHPTGLPVSTIPLPVLNGKLWGDVAGINNGIEWTPPNQFANVQDLLAIQTYISNAAVQPHFTVANLQAISSTDSCVNAFVNTGDVLIAVNAIGGSSYGPPSTTKVVDPALCPVCP